MLRLNLSDLGKGLIVAVLVAFLGAVQSALTGHGLDIASYDWNAILDISWKAAAAYLGKNLLSDSQGKFLGKV